MNDYHVAITETLPDLLDAIDSMIKKRVRLATCEALKREMMIKAYQHAVENLSSVIDVINIATVELRETSHPEIDHAT